MPFAVPEVTSRRVSVQTWYLYRATRALRLHVQSIAAVGEGQRLIFIQQSLHEFLAVPGRWTCTHMTRSQGKRHCMWLTFCQQSRMTFWLWLGLILLALMLWNQEEMQSSQDCAHPPAQTHMGFWSLSKRCPYMCHAFGSKGER